MEASLLLLRWRCKKASVALLERSMASLGSISPLSFNSFPIQLPVRKVKSGKLWWTVPLKKKHRVTGDDASLHRGRLSCQSYLMVIIFLSVMLESSFFILLMFADHWNFSELMKKIGCLTRGKSSSSKGNIQASSAIPHLIEKQRLPQNRIQHNIKAVLVQMEVGDHTTT